MYYDMAYIIIKSFVIVFILGVVVINTPLIKGLERLIAQPINTTFLIMNNYKIESTISCRMIYRKMHTKHQKTKRFNICYQLNTGSLEEGTLQSKRSFMGIEI